MKRIDLVFRSVGERTAQFALEQAIKNIQPQHVHLIENVKPFSLAVTQMLTIAYDCDFVVFMDADCLIMEDMQPFLQSNHYPYVDCYVLDKFRNHIHCGVHITRVDVVQAMKDVQIPVDDLKYILRPESRLRELALAKLNLGKTFKKFAIYHDFFQFYYDIFAKYALRELRSREDYSRTKLNMNQRDWIRQKDDLDFVIANSAFEYTRRMISPDAPNHKIAKFIVSLPEIASQQLSQLSILEKPPFAPQEALDLITKFNFKGKDWNQKMKVFGIGLSRTGTKSLTMALNNIGNNVIHYPNDQKTLKELIAGNYNFSCLQNFDGITDITIAPFYAQLDKLFPDSKFILTLRDRKAWLKSLEDSWRNKPLIDDSSNHLIQLRIVLRMAVYGTCVFNEERLSYVYDLHYKNVLDYFKDRPESLLVINICDGEGWEKLCPFLGYPITDEPFPSINQKKKLNGNSN